MGTPGWRGMKPTRWSFPCITLPVRVATSFWRTTENNRRARYYRLTRAGRKALGEAESSFDRLIGAIARVMRPA